MAFGIIPIIIGVIIFLITFSIDSSTVMQQQVKHIDFVCAAIFVIGGVLILNIRAGIELIVTKLDEIIDNTAVEYEETETSKPSDEQNSSLRNKYEAFTNEDKNK